MLSLASLRSLRTGPADARVARGAPGWPRGQLWSAAAVALATLGCAPPGPRSDASDLHPFARMQAPLADGTPQLAYLQAGPAQGPRLLLVHGTPGSAAAWGDYLVNPPAGVEVLALDRPGFGASGPDDALVSLEAQALALSSLLPRDGRKAILVGHSLGGPIAARVAAEQGERVAALILVAAALDPLLERVHPLQHLGARAPVRWLLPRALRNANAELMVLESELRTLQPWLARVTVPVYVLHGTADDLVPVANVDYIRTQFSAARCMEVRLLDGQNHFLPWNSEVPLREMIATAVAGTQC